MPAGFQDIGPDQRFRRQGIGYISANRIAAGDRPLTQQDVRTGDFKRDRFLSESILQDFLDGLSADIEGDRLPEPYLLAVDKRKAGRILQLADESVQCGLPDLEVQTRRPVLCGERRNSENYP